MVFCVFSNCAARMQSSAGWWATLFFLAATVSTSAAQRELTPTWTELQCWCGWHQL